MGPELRIEAFFDPATSSLTYLVHDPIARDAVVIDPVLDYDQATGSPSTASVEKVADAASALGLRVHYVLETHPHADHVSASQWLKRRFGAQVAIGERIRDVQAACKAELGLAPGLATDGRQFDRLLADGERFHAGAIAIEVLGVPGHTPACVAYRIGDAIFVGDSLFMPDYGTARCDFPAGDAATLYASIHDRLYALPDDTRVFVGHDYQPGGRELRWQTTIGASKQGNVHLRADTTRDAFVALRCGRDATLTPPRLFRPSIDINVNAGILDVD